VAQYTEAWEFSSDDVIGNLGPVDHPVTPQKHIKSKMFV
jgi:hypothetical protein